MDREIDGDDLMATVIAILTVPRPTAVDALAVPTGQGEEWRLEHAIRLWQADSDIRLLLVANGNPAEQTYRDLTFEHLRSLGLQRLDGVHIQPDAAPNTGLQARWIADQVEHHDVRDLGLVVSPYHLPRVYLTVLKALKERIPLYPFPVPVAPGRKVPETGATAYELVPGEMARILEYADEGWLATPAEFRDYLARDFPWCDGHPGGDRLRP
jgi:hypothetical protein